MASLIKQKFTDHLDLKLRLLLTGEKELVEGNTWKDTFWGQNKQGVGDNHLGKILMNLRTSIRNTEGGTLGVFKDFLNNRDLPFMTDIVSKLHTLAQEYHNSCPTGWGNDVDATVVSDFLTSLK